MTRKSLTELREEMRAVARGERKPSPLPTSQLLPALTPESLELLRILLQDKPSTVGELVERSNRAQPNVSRSLQMLASHGLVRLTRVGREVRPEAAAAELRLNLATGTYQACAIKGA